MVGAGGVAVVAEASSDAVAVTILANPIKSIVITMYFLFYTTWIYL
jgi:hypothetical protein